MSPATPSETDLTPHNGSHHPFKPPRVPKAADATFEPRMGTRERTFPYQRLLPYETESKEEILQKLDEILDNLFIAVGGGDLEGIFGTQSGGIFAHWTRELSNWLKLKFEFPLERRIKLITLYLNVTLQATEMAGVERYTAILGQLTGNSTANEWMRKNPPFTCDLWDRYFNAMTKMVPTKFNKTFLNRMGAKGFTALTSVAMKIQIMPLDCDFDKYWDKILSLLNGPTEYMSDTLVNLVVIMMSQIPVEQPETFRKVIPMLFYLWELVPEDSFYETQILYSLATVARTAIGLANVKIEDYGIFTEAQMRRIFSAFSRLLASQKHATFDNDQSAFIQWVVVASLAGDSESHLLDLLESLIKAVEPYCHPSHPESNHVLRFIAEFVDAFSIRNSQEESNEPGHVESRKFTPEIRERFTRTMLEPLEYGLYSKSRATVSCTLPALYKLAYMCPDIVIPSLLRDIYPCLQGLYTPHRTLSSLSALAAITPILVRHPQYAFHLTSLIELVTPCIDANDPIKASLAIRFIQNAATCTPFWPLSESSQLAQEHVANIVLSMELPNFEYPHYQHEDAVEILKSSTVGFETIALSIFDRVIALIENMPEKANEIKNSPEYNLTFLVPIAMSSIFNAVSPQILHKLVDRLIDVLVNNPIHNGAEMVGHICRALVSASPSLVFPKLFPILDTSIRYEVTENSAGQNRSFGFRDRNFIWYLSMLNLSLNSAAIEILPFKHKLSSLITFLRENTKGKSVYYVSNTIHNTIASLVSTGCEDYGVVAPGKDATWEDWGSKVDLSELKLKWHIPSLTEVEFACELYTQHVWLSLKNLDAIVRDQNGETRAPTEFSDAVTNNLAYLRTTSGSIASLLDPDYENMAIPEMANRHPSGEEGPQSSDHLEFPELSAADKEEEDDAELESLQPFLKYKVNTFFEGGKYHQLYTMLHETRNRVGEKLLQLLQQLVQNHESDNQSLRSIILVIKVWFSDVGIERSAKLYQYQKTYYSAESRVFKINGLRKTLFPRPTLARRAVVYHLQRLNYGTGVRQMSQLDKALLMQLVECTLSIYPDIRQSAQAALYSTIKVFARSRSLIYPHILQEISTAIAADDFKRAESGLLFLNYRSMKSVVKRRYNNIIAFFRTIFAAINADNQQLNITASTLGQRVIEDIRLPASLRVETGIEHLLNDESEELVTKLNQQMIQKRANSFDQARKLVEFVVGYKHGDHWRTKIIVLYVLNATLACPQLTYDEDSLKILSQGTLSQNPIVRRLAQDVMTVQLAKMVPKSLKSYDFSIHRLDYDDSLLEDGVRATSDEMVAAIKGEAEPKWYYDSKFMNPYLFRYSRSNSGGWLKWPSTALMSPATSCFELRLNDEDLVPLKNWAATIDKQWLATYVSRSAVELKEDENVLQLMNGMVLKYVFSLSDCGITSLDFDDVLDVINKSCDFNDVHWHRVLAEVFFALCNAQPLFSLAARKKTIEILKYIERKVATSNFGHESLTFWVSSMRACNINVDLRRIKSVLDGIMNLELSTNSSTRESYTLALRSELINAHAWKYPLELGMIKNLCQNFGHPLDSIREEVVNQLAIAVSVIPRHMLEDLSQLNVETGISSVEKAEEYTELLEDVLREVSPSTKDTNFIDKARAYCLFAIQLAGKPSFHNMNRALVHEVIPNLFKLSNIRDDKELIKSLNEAFERTSTHFYSDEALSRIVEMIGQWVTDATWHQKIRALLFLQKFYSKNMFRFSPVLEKSLLDTIYTALFDSQAEVRDLASQLLMRWIMCEPPKSRQGLIDSIRKRFSKVLLTSKELVERHGAALGLGSLIGAFPYETPLPLWIPETLSTLSRYSSGGNIVSISVKKTFSDFKRQRQDTWHLDQKRFDQDQLESLEGVLFRNYFV